MRLALVPVGEVAAPVLQGLMDGLPGALPVQPELRPALEDATWEGGPLAASAVVDALRAQGGWTLGITERTVLDEGGEPVIGQAEVGGAAAVISLAALRGSDPLALPHRVLASAVHEVGHLAGLEHCGDPGCAMHPSRCLRDTDAKRAAPCEACAKSMRTRIARGA